MKLIFVLLTGLFWLNSFSQNAVTGPAIITSITNKPFFQFLLKKNGDVLYNYDSTDLDRGLLPIEKPTKEKFVQAINGIEEKYKVKITEEAIIIRAESQVVYTQFKPVKEALKEKQLFKFRIVIISDTEVVTNNNPEKEGKENIIPVSQNALVIILVANDEIFYYHGNDCEQLSKSDFKKIAEVLRHEKKNVAEKDLFIAIKATTESTFKNTIDLLDAIVLGGIPAKHYAEIDITAAEINCIENFKKQ